MKKLLITMIALVGLVAFSGCSKDDRLSVNPEKVTLIHDQKIKLHVGNSNGDVTYKSENPLIASVSTDGVVKGKVRGKTNINITSGGKKGVCEVNVATLINFIDEPITEFGASKETIKRKFPTGIKINSEDDDRIVYEKKQDGTPFRYVYSFKNGKLEVSAFALPILSKSAYSVIDFTLERYIVIERTGTYQFIMTSPQKDYRVVVFAEENVLFVMYAATKEYKYKQKAIRNLLAQ